MKRIPKRYLSISVACAIVLLNCMTVDIAAADNPVCTDCPADPDSFLTMLERHVPEDAITAAAYYDTIDPDEKKNNLCGLAG
jgi:hypothetical protein